MKHRCIIARLNEPHIARMYVLDFDQNLINNIRVLCTKSPETIRYFVPEELFLELRNGYPVQMTAQCRDRKGGRTIPIDPLKVLIDQLREAPGAVPDPEGIEIRILVEGYELPAPVEGLGFLKRTPRRDPWLAAGKPSNTGMQARAQAQKRTSRKEPAPKSSVKRTSARPEGTSGTSGSQRSYYSQKDAYAEPAISRRTLTRAALIRAFAAVLLILAAAGFWFMKDASARRFREAMREAKYSEAVMVYNDKILGHPSRESKADPEFVSAVSAIETDYLAETKGYEESRGALGVLTGIRKNELSQLAQSALDEIEALEHSSAVYQEGLEAMGDGDYVSAVKAFSALQESPYKDSVDKLALCIDRLVKSCVGIRSEEEYPDAAAKIEAAIELMPDNEQLIEARDACRSKYEQLVINSAITAADEKIEAGDHAGAFEAMAAAQEKLPDNEKLQGKMAEYRLAFVTGVTKEVCGKVDEGDTEDARSLLEESLEILDCDEFDSLLSQVEAVDDRPYSEPRAYYADKCAESRSEGSIRKKGQKDEYRVKAQESGPYRFLLSKVPYGLAVRLVIYAQDGSEIYDSGVVGTGSDDRPDTDEKAVSAGRSDTEKKASSGNEQVGDKKAGSGSGADAADKPDSNEDAAAGSSSNKKADAEEKKMPTAGASTTCRLEKDETYTVEIQAVEGKGSYVFTVREQKPAADITSFDLVRDQMEFADQQIQYTFTPAMSGVYRLDLADAEKLSGLRADIYDPLGAKAAGAVLENGEGLTVRLEADETYLIRAAQPEKTGEYTLRLGKPSPPEDLTGKNIAAGAITYIDQRNVYRLTTDADSRLLFTIGNLPEGSSVGLDLYDPLGYKIGSGDSLRNGESVTADVEAGQTIEIQVTQRSGKGEYTLTVREDG